MSLKARKFPRSMEKARKKKTSLILTILLNLKLEDSNASRSKVKRKSS